MTENIDIMSYIKNINSRHKREFKIEDREEFGMVLKTLNQFSLPTTNFSNNLNSLLMKKENEENITFFKTCAVACYRPSINTIDYIYDIDLFHELFHMASSRINDENESNCTGITYFDRNKKCAIELDEGITDMFASLTNENVNVAYPLGKLTAVSIAMIFGYDVFKGYFNNSYEEFIEGFPKNVQDDIVILIDTLDDFLSAKKNIRLNNETSCINLSEIVFEVISQLVDLFQKCKNGDVAEFKEFIKESLNDPSFDVFREIAYLSSINVDEMGDDPLGL